MRRFILKTILMHEICTGCCCCCCCCRRLLFSKTVRALVGLARMTPFISNKRYLHTSLSLFSLGEGALGNGQRHDDDIFFLFHRHPRHRTTSPLIQLSVQHTCHYCQNGAYKSRSVQSSKWSSRICPPRPCPQKWALDVGLNHFRTAVSTVSTAVPC